MSLSKKDKKEKLKKQKSFLEGHQADYIRDWLNHIDETISNLPDGSPKRKGNKTMKQHLIMLRNDLQGNPLKYIEDKQKKVDKMILELEDGD